MLGASSDVLVTRREELLVVMPSATSSFLLLVEMHLVTSSFLLLVATHLATNYCSSILATSLLQECVVVLSYCNLFQVMASSLQIHHDQHQVFKP